MRRCWRFVGGKRGYKEREATMNVRSGRPGAESVDVVVVGAGQAGLAVSYYLRAFGIEHVVLQRGRVGDSWRAARWAAPIVGIPGVSPPRPPARTPLPAQRLQRTGDGSRLASQPVPPCHSWCRS